MIISILVSSAICFVLSRIYYKKYNINKLNSEKFKKAQNILTQLMFYDTSKILNIFYDALNKSNNNCQILNNGITINNTLLIPCFNQILDENLFTKIYNSFLKSKLKKLIILCSNTSDSLKIFINNFENLNLEIISGTDVYIKIIEPYNIEIKDVVKIKTSSKIKLSELKNIAFNKKNAKGYFLSGILIMISSLFYRFSLYYQIFGTVLFALSLFSYFNTSFNKQNKTIFFE